jgi:hypothetical protein
MFWWPNPTSEGSDKKPLGVHQKKGKRKSRKAKQNALLYSLAKLSNDKTVHMNLRNSTYLSTHARTNHMKTEGTATHGAQIWTSLHAALGGFLDEHDAEGDGGGVERVGHPAHHPAHAGDALRRVLGRHGQRRRSNQRDDELHADRAQRVLGELPDELCELLAVQEAVQVDVIVLHVSEKNILAIKSYHSVSVLFVVQNLSVFNIAKLFFSHK